MLGQTDFERILQTKTIKIERDACVKSDGIGPELLPDAQQDDIAAAP